MSNHIPPDKLLPQDMVHIFDHGPKEEPLAEPKLLPMHAVDAKHAMAVEPERYALEPRVSEQMPEPEPEPEHTGADGPAWYPPPGEPENESVVDFGTGEEEV